MTAAATSILISLAASGPASAKTKAQCMKEWHANKAANQTAGKTEKAYVAECRGTSSVATKPAADAKPEKDYSGSGREGGGGGRM